MKKPKIHFKIKAVIFDMDGVITNTMPDHYKAWKRVFSKAGMAISKKELYLREGQPGIITLREIFKERGLTYSEDLIKNILAGKEELFKKIVKQRFVPGARNFLRFLKKKGFVLGLVTGTACHEVDRILPDYLRNLFSVMITGCEVKKGKPDPEPYLKAIKNLRIKSHEAVVIENAPFGILSAKRAGLKCLALETSLPRNYLKEADLISHSYADLRKRVSFEKKGMSSAQD